MNYYDLELDEAIIIQSSNVSRDGYDESEFEDEYLQEILLTNKNIVYVTADEDGAEGEDCNIITVPLSAVKVINGQAQVKEVQHDLYGLCLQVQFVHGVEYWRFGIKAKQQIPRWAVEINKAVLAAPRANVKTSNIRQSNSSVTPMHEEQNADSFCFCANCGSRVLRAAKFCSECGSKAGQVANSNNEQSSVVYDGRIHKCKNCGEVLRAFETICPACGYELRDTYASAAIRSFAEKIEALQQNGKYKDKSNIINLIRTFPIPNTREDLFEFIILASANIREDRYSSELPKYKKEISDAWRAKFEQAYHKALVAFPDDGAVKQFTFIYKSKKKEIRQQKLRKSLISIGLGVIGLTLLIAGIALQSANEGSMWMMLSMLGLAMLCSIPAFSLGS